MTNQEPSGKAIASLVCGILGLLQVIPFLGPILAIALGWGEEDGVGKAGVILGWITLALYALVALAIVALVVLAGGISIFANS